MHFDPANLTDEQKFQLLNSQIIAAGALACAYRVGGQPLEAKDFEKAFSRAMFAISAEVDIHLKKLSS